MGTMQDMQKQLDCQAERIDALEEELQRIRSTIAHQLTEVKNGLGSRVIRVLRGPAKRGGKLREYGLVAHHKRDVDLSIFPDYTIAARNRAEAMRQAKAWLRDRLAGGGFRGETHASAYRIELHMADA